MKKGILSACVLLALVVSCRTVLAQGSGKAGAENKRAKRAKEIGSATKSKPTDPNELRKLAEARRTRDKNRERAGTREEREKRRQELLKLREKARSERGAGAPGEGPLTGKDHQRQVEALKKQVAAQEAKHHKRMARLNRIKELAAGDAETAARVDRLVQKEQKRYSGKKRRLAMRERMLLRLQEGKPPARPPRPDREKLKGDAQDAMRKREAWMKKKAEAEAKAKAEAESKEEAAKEEGADEESK